MSAAIYQCIDRYTFEQYLKDSGVDNELGHHDFDDGSMTRRLQTAVTSIEELEAFALLIYRAAHYAGQRSMG